MVREKILKKFELSEIVEDTYRGYGNLNMSVGYEKSSSTSEPYYRNEIQTMISVNCDTLSNVEQLKVLRNLIDEAIQKIERIENE